MTNKLALSDIQTKIPHRFENLLIDAVTVHHDREFLEADFSVSITADDPLGRTVFFQELPNGKRVLLSAVLMEILALASICMHESSPKAFFAAIAQFQRHGVYELGGALSGHTIHTKRKGPFFKNTGTLLTSQEVAPAAGEVTAIFMESNPEAPKNTGSQSAASLSESLNLPIDRSLWQRHPQLVMADTLLEASHDHALTRYTFPMDHALLRGHFPDFPVMMGVLQWQAVCDACAIWARHQNKAGRLTIACDGQITKADGAPVCDISGMEAEVILTDTHTFADVIRTQKVGFRSMVRPGETLLIQATNIRCA